MTFDLEQTDKLLSTTRAVRRRLDLERDVPDDLLLRCIELAEQAPTGANIASRRWMVVRDPETKVKLANLYRAAGAGGIIQEAEKQRGAGNPKQRVMDSAAHLAANMERVPALVLVTVLGRHDGSGRPGLFDSVIQAAWSFCLALRSRGLGSAWTTMHLGKSDEIAELLGIPEGVTQVVLLPVAWTIGTEFGPAPRREASEITWFDRWGFTKEQPGELGSLISELPGVTVEVDVAAPPERIWELISDINMPAQFSDEFQGADWVDAGSPQAGASFIGKNERPGRAWETTSFVVVCDQPQAFGWNVNDPDNPSAQWRFELEPVGGNTRLRFRMIIGPGVSGTARAMEESPDQAQQILAGRQEQHRGNMYLTIQGIKRLAETGS
jgi:nitroreductase